MDRLNNEFFNQDTITVAKELLGCKLSIKIKDKVYSGMIVETEAYLPDDPASHAYNGKTKRTQTMFSKAGIAYVYFIYGMYYCLNVVTEKKEFPAAVLIRALEPIENITNSNGPAKLCRELHITTEQNEVDFTDENSKLWIEKFKNIKSKNIVKTTRIGIKKAVDKKWRFYIKDNKFISKK